MIESPITDEDDGPLFDLMWGSDHAEGLVFSRQVLKHVEQPRLSSSPAATTQE